MTFCAIPPLPVLLLPFLFLLVVATVTYSNKKLSQAYMSVR